MNHPNPVILHVEDDPNDVLLVERAFRKANLTVRIENAADGELAAAYLSGEGAYADRGRYPLPVLVLLDLKLPRKSGLELLAWIRNHPTLKPLPVTVLTSSRHERDICNAYQRGANSYLVKPVNFDALFEMIQLVHTYWIQLNECPSL